LHTIADSLTTLDDHLLVTISADRFLYATPEQADEIADLMEILGCQVFHGTLAWFLSRSDSMFVDAADLLKTLRACIPSRPLLTVRARTPVS